MADADADADAGIAASLLLKLWEVSRPLRQSTKTSDAHLI